MMVEREVKVLDHGYVRMVEAWGSDESAMLDGIFPRTMALFNGAVSK